MLTVYLIGSLSVLCFMAWTLSEVVQEQGGMDSFDAITALVLVVLIPMGLAVLMKEV